MVWTFSQKTTFTGFSTAQEAQILFFTSAKTESRYESVLDLKDLFTLDQYRVKDLLH
jgi:hypothetical protein